MLRPWILTCMHRIIISKQRKGSYVNSRQTSPSVLILLPPSPFPPCSLRFSLSLSLSFLSLSLSLSLFAYFVLYLTPFRFPYFLLILVQPPPPPRLFRSLFPRPPHPSFYSLLLSLGTPPPPPPPVYCDRPDLFHLSLVLSVGSGDLSTRHPCQLELFRNVRRN